MTGGPGGRSRPGRVLGGRYRLGEVIGAGAMAEVHAATDATLGREVAVKVLRAQYAGDGEFVARFRQEARIAASVSHPHLVNVYDTGDEVEPGTGHVRPYIVMERLPGETLADRLRHGPVPVDEAVEIARQVAAGVGFAHRRNLVHRDLKPANILLAADGDAKVADFGLAQDLRASNATQPGTVWGTVQYLSPERAQGDPATASSDIYGLGVIVYEMLAGHPPFEGGTPASIMMRQVGEAPRPLGEIVPAYRGEVESAVMRALAKAPRDRYESMEAFAASLERISAFRTMRSSGAMPLDDPGMTRVVPAVGGLPAPERRRRTATPLPRTGARVAGGTPPPRDGRAGTSTRTRTAIAFGILSFFALMAVGAWLVRAFAIPGIADVPLPMPTVPALTVATPFPVAEATAPPPSPTPATVLVPVVTGETATRARETLAALGLVTEVVEDWSRVAPAGTIFGQDPTAGSSVTRGRTVRLVVSKGVQRIIVPNTIGKTGQNARDELVRAGLRVELVEEHTPLTVAGVVFEQQPRGGEVDPEQPVVIRVSRGPARPMVPGVIGMRADDARRVLEQAGFRVALRHEANSGVDQDVAFAQVPLAGTTADRDSTVDVRVRRNPMPGATAPGGGAPGAGTPAPTVAARATGPAGVASATPGSGTPTRTLVPGGASGVIVPVGAGTTVARTPSTVVAVLPTATPRPVPQAVAGPNASPTQALVSTPLPGR